jgi:rsbT co-antagonist protein RsbR
MTDSGSLGELEDEYLADRIANILLALADVGEGNYDIHLEVDLPPDHPLGALTVGIRQMTQALAEERQSALRLQRELEEKLALIERQRVAMRELSTPIIEVWQGILCLPIVGVVDTVRSTEMTDSLLQAVNERSVECAIVDITGIDVMDTRTADHFLGMSRAVHLLGARCMVSGINSAIAQTMVHMGVEMQGVEFYRSLRDALKAQIPLISNGRAAKERP